MRFVEFDDLWEVRSPLLGEPFVMPAGLDAGLAATSERFPQHADALAQYFTRIANMREALASAVLHQRDPIWWILHAGRSLWPFVRQIRLSLGQVLDSLFGEDEAVKLALCANLIYYTDDPDRMWFPHWGVAQGSYHLGGGHYPYGGSRRLSEHLAGFIRDAGGEVETGRLVTRLMVEDGRVSGVEHRAAECDDADVQAESAPLVFGNATPHALAEMLPDELRPSFTKRFAGRPVSLSLWTIALGFDRRPRELGVERYSTAVFPAPMRALRETARQRSMLSAVPNGRAPHYIFVDYSAVDTGLASKPPFLGTIAGVDRLENWQGLNAHEYRERRERWIDLMIGSLEQEFPGISRSIVQRHMTTASGAARYLNTPAGAIYGFAPERRNQVVDPRTSVRGLWLASAFAGLGGYSGAIVGAGWAAKSALRESGRDWERAAAPR